MLKDRDAVANIAVKDMAAARDFYANTLGLAQMSTIGEEVTVYKSGSTKLCVYRSQYAGTNKATNVTWSVGDEIEKIVQTLKAKGVKFEHYDMPDMTLQGDVHVSGDMKVAWFKDPDGNILNLIND